MEVIYHRGIQRDIRAAVMFHDEESGSALGDRFFLEAEAIAAKVLRNPKGFQFTVPGLRRAPLNSVPSHFLFQGDGERVRFLVLRHHKRHPSFGLWRK